MYNIDKELSEKVKKVEKNIENIFKCLEKTREFNQIKVLDAFRKYKVASTDFNSTTGYGYDDIGRDKLDKVYSEVFVAEKALVRIQIVNGTQAISLCLYGNLRPGDELLCGSGNPYDTLEEVIGISGSGMGSLKEFGINTKIVPLLDEGDVDLEGILKSISSNTKMIYLQRSMGYSWRNGLSIEKLSKIIKAIKKVNHEIIVMVDNCYGEFVEEREPTEVGADLIAGSLIKNPGGSLAPMGGYIAGKAICVEKASYMLTSPGIGGEVGATLNQNRELYQGFFMAPHIVCESLKGAVFCSGLFTELGYEVIPKIDDYRTDIIQGIKIKNENKLIKFCQGIQKGSPIDSHVKPYPWDMPGYQHKVIMAAGTFIQGASSELTADAPIKEPYIAYLQGGIVYEAAKYGILQGIKNMTEN